MDEELLGALKLARGWVEFVAVQCSYHGCTVDDCGSKRAERDLAVIDAVLAKASDPGIPVYKTGKGETEVFEKGEE